MFVGAHGGLRIGELAALRRSRVDFADGIVDVAETVNELKGKLVVGPPKTRSSRRKVSLPLGGHGGAGRPSAGAGAAHRSGLQGSGRRPAPHLNFRRNIWRTAVADANLAGLRIHDLWHTAVAARAGHTSVSFVLDRYGHLFSEADTALRARLDSLLRASTEHRRNTDA